MRRERRAQGFSLIELLVALAIVALLSAWALPNVQAQMQRARRIDATTTLLQAANWMERAATAQGPYPMDRDHGGPGVPEALTQSPDGHYRLTLEATDGQSFTLTAWPQGAQAHDACGWLRLDALGTRSAQSGEARCWR